MLVNWSTSSRIFYLFVIIFFFQQPKLHLRNVLNYSQLHTLSARRRHLNVLILTNVFIGSKYFPTLLEGDGLRVPNRNFRHFSLFNVNLKRRNRLPSPRHQYHCRRKFRRQCTDICNGRSDSVNLTG
jgi:hypothetical protein